MTLAAPRPNEEAIAIRRAGDAPVRVMGPGLPAEGIEVPQGKEVVFEAVALPRLPCDFCAGPAVKMVSGGDGVRSWRRFRCKSEDCARSAGTGAPETNPDRLGHQLDELPYEDALLAARLMDADGPDLVWRRREQARCVKPLECGVGDHAPEAIEQEWAKWKRATRGDDGDVKRHPGGRPKTKVSPKR